MKRQALSVGDGGRTWRSFGVNHYNSAVRVELPQEVPPRRRLPHPDRVDDTVFPQPLL